MKSFSLDPLQELRLETAGKSTVQVKLVSGTAEVFGTEIPLDSVFSLSCLPGRKSKTSIYTWHGCTIEVSGECSSDYVAGDTPMNSYLNVHLACEQMRDSISKYPAQLGPRIMIVGPMDCGKSSLSKILLNYAVKQNRTPLFVDIDTNEGSLSVPGTIGAAVISKHVDVEEEFSPSLIHLGSTPMIHYYGYSCPLTFPKFYNRTCSKLGESVLNKLKEERESGCIINTPYQFVETAGFELLAHAIDAFKVNVLLVIGHERLYSDLVRKYSGNEGISILKLSKSGGVASRDKAFRRMLSMARVKEYFYGSPGRHDLAPLSVTISFNDILIRRVTEGATIPSSALPLGMDQMVMDTKFVKCEPGDILLHSILAVSRALPPDGAPWSSEEETQALITSPIAGFINIVEVDEEKKKMTILSPSVGKLPFIYLIMGELKWMDN